MIKNKVFHSIKLLKNSIMSLKLKPIVKTIMISLMIKSKNRYIIKLGSKISKFIELQYMDFLFYSKFIKPGDLCFDIGANLGNKTETFLRLGADVISVEPQSYCVNQLNKRFIGISNVKILNIAVGKSKCRKKIHICDEGYGMATISKKFMNLKKHALFHWSDYEIINMSTLDELIELYGIPKLCKIDVEGYELEVIKGLSSKIQFISFESHIGFIKEVEIIFKLLESRFGYFKVNFSLGEWSKFYNNSWERPDIILNIIDSIKKPGMYFNFLVKFNEK